MDPLSPLRVTPRVRLPPVFFPSRSAAWARAWRTLGTTLWFGLLGSLLGTHARADDRLACVIASDEGQRLRTNHRLIDARAQFIACARPECPGIVREACAGWLTSVERDIPSVVVTASDGSGADVLDATVTVDGAPLLSKLDGSAVAVDPGVHTFRVTRRDGVVAEVTHLIPQGQDNVGVAVRFRDASAPAPVSYPPRAAVVAPPPDAVRARSTHHVLGIATGAVGLAGIGVGAATGVAALSAMSDVNALCPSHTGCSSKALADHSTAVTYGVASDIGFIAGGVLVAAGLTLYLTAPNDAPLRLSLLPGGLRLAGTF